MGVPNFVQYTLSAHATQRFNERIDNSKTNMEILKFVRGGLSRANRIEVKPDGSQVWLDELEEITYIISVGAKKVITVYRSTDREASELRQAVAKSSPQLQKAIENTAKRLVNTAIRDSSQELIALTERALELYTLTATLKRGDVLRVKMLELEVIEEEIDKIKRERNTLVSEAKCLL
ncbi:hypothetical protein EH802P2_00068 [Enterococcus phage EH802P2]|nr:hypothetical protein EH93P1_00062 [Enterococcus phage EH93P1]WAX15902.1 hypothetical protein EH93P2_00020 [Enterococcus phage EH93P2]WAX16027.1 hypothetical protein EH802P1_00031 [Enterococcus phage EH802P1]WAX16173.1 hypothetical protein EH802P2_00068 [Enterococcus phage EH802P2]